jgi:hypothetical protein
MRAYLTFLIFLSGIAACAQAEPPDKQRRPDLVKVGMSQRQVEALIGRSHETCWSHSDKGQDNFACFRDKKSRTSRLSPGFELTCRQPKSAHTFRQ